MLSLSLNFNINERVGHNPPSNLSNSVFLAVCLPWPKGLFHLAQCQWGKRLIIGPLSKNHSQH